MYVLRCKACGTGMTVNPPVMRQKRTTCLGCGKFGRLDTGYLKSDRHGFFPDPTETGPK